MCMCVSIFTIIFEALKIALHYAYANELEHLVAL
jgi:hypothetical protein